MEEYEIIIRNSKVENREWHWIPGARTINEFEVRHMIVTDTGEAQLLKVAVIPTTEISMNYDGVVGFYHMIDRLDGWIREQHVKED